MNIKMFFNLLFLLLVFTPRVNAQKTGFDKSSFYHAMASDDLNEISTQLNNIRTLSFNEKDAFEGALMMKKAGLVSKTKEKLALFKSGRIKLEACIKKETGNTEYYFLRLIIQEHAPKIVNYRDELESDCLLVRTKYKTLPAVVQQAVIDYNKKSRVLKLA